MCICKPLLMYVSWYWSEILFTRKTTHKIHHTRTRAQRTNTKIWCAVIERRHPATRGRQTQGAGTVVVAPLSVARVVPQIHTEFDHICAQPLTAFSRSPFANTEAHANRRWFGCVGLGACDGSFDVTGVFLGGSKC